ncbi:hypothetical protein VSX61_04265 [Brenneria populi subsp. brevivirga]|nr:hypothetical protein [Brenneria populi subsp. brevivirga]
MNENGLPPASLAETAMSRMKMMFGERLSLRDSIVDNKTQRLMKNIG